MTIIKQFFACPTDFVTLNIGTIPFLSGAVYVIQKLFQSLLSPSFLDGCFTLIAPTGNNKNAQKNSWQKTNILHFLETGLLTLPIAIIF